MHLFYLYNLQLVVEKCRNNTKQIFLFFIQWIFISLLNICSVHDVNDFQMKTRHIWQVHPPHNQLNCALTNMGMPSLLRKSRLAVSTLQQDKIHYFYIQPLGTLNSKTCLIMLQGLTSTCKKEHLYNIFGKKKCLYVFH